MKVPTSGITDDLRLRLDTSPFETGHSAIDAGAIGALSQPSPRADAHSLDGEAILRVDVWRGAASGARGLNASAAQPSISPGLDARAALDAGAAHVLAALG